MKGSQVAGLAGGWLAIALSMAAIGSLAVGRVGVSSSEAQVQVTVTKSVRAGIPSAISQAAEVPVSVVAVPSVTAPDPGLRTAVLTEFAQSFTASRTTAAPARPQTTSAAAPQTSSTGTPTAIEVSVPNTGVLEPGENTATTAPTASSPIMSDTPKMTPTSKPSEPSDHPKAAVVFATWRRAQGAILAGCKGSALVSVEPTAGEGYLIVEQPGSVRSTIHFRGPSPLDVHVSCASGSPTFSILH